MSRTLSRVVAAINSFRGHMEQIIFDNYLLRPATFLEDVKGSLFNNSNISHPSLEVVCLFYRKYCNHPFSEVNVSFLLVVPLFVSRCQSLSFVVTRCATCCHSLSFIVICCHSLSFVVTCCTSRCHLLSLVVSRCHSLLFAVTRCHSMYHSSVFL